MPTKAEVPSLGATRRAFLHLGERRHRLRCPSGSRSDVDSCRLEAVSGDRGLDTRRQAPGLTDL